MNFPIVSLFSGIGGLDLGLEAAGLGTVTHHVEADPFCRSILQHHWPEATTHDDVRTFHPAAAGVPAHPIVCGGFPCQDISAANPNGKGLDGRRSGLWWEFARVIDEAKPVGVVIENSDRLVRRGLDQVVAFLSDRGFEVEATRLHASDVGAPHRRARLFIVAWHPGRVADAHRQQLRLEPGGCVGTNGQGTALARYLGAAVGHAHGEGEPQQGGPLGEERRRPSYAGQLGVADAAGIGRAPGLGGGEVRQAGPTSAGAGARTPESPVGGRSHGFPRGLDRPWPAGKGPGQHPWEPPRTVGPRALPGRSQRVKAYGNAVVPQVAYVVGCRLFEHLNPHQGA